MKKALVILLTMSSLTCFSQYDDFDFINRLNQQSRNSTVFESLIRAEQQRVQQQNEQIIRQADYEFEQRIQRARYEKRLIAESLLANGFSFVRNADTAGMSRFRNAFIEIDSMLKGTKELSIARSVFLVENAYYENGLDYSEYQSFIKRKAEFCNRIIKESKQNPNDNLAKNMAIFRLLTEKVPFKNRGKERMEYHLPLQYDNYDYDSKEYFDSHFITKLINSNIGQCYSMPLYYLIIAETMNAEAYWSQSPKHAFVKIKDTKGNWYNIELTCQSVLSDAHYTNTGYIKAEALQNKIYLEPLDKKQIVAHQLLNLAQTYHKKYGFDDFYLKCVDSVPQYIPNSVDALKMKASYYQNALIYAAELLHKQDLQSFGDLQPLANKTHDLLEVYYRKIDDLGYEELPDEIYKTWLQYIEKQKAISDKNRIMILNEIR